LATSNEIFLLFVGKSTAEGFQVLKR